MTRFHENLIKVRQQQQQQEQQQQQQQQQSHSKNPSAILARIQKPSNKS